MAEITVITNQRYRGHRRNEVITVEDTPQIRGLIRRGRLDLVDPPSLEQLDGNSTQSSSTTTADPELHDEVKRPSRKGSRKKSTESPAEGEGTGSEGSGDAGGFFADRSDNPEGEAYRPDYE